jgi:hypothetical protein
LKLNFNPSFLLVETFPDISQKSFESGKLLSSALKVPFKSGLGVWTDGPLCLQKPLASLKAFSV